MSKHVIWNGVIVKRKGLKEAIAYMQHDIWAHWMRYQIGVSEENEDGSVTIPAKQVKRWKRQMGTSYADLSEDEKKSDRDQAKKITDFLDHITFWTDLHTLFGVLSEKI